MKLCDNDVPLSSSIIKKKNNKFNNYTRFRHKIFQYLPCTLQRHLYIDHFLTRSIQKTYNSIEEPQSGIAQSRQAKQNH